MDINNYQVYSVISDKNRNKALSDEELLKTVLEKFDKISNSESATRILKEEFNIAEPSMHQPFGETGYINYQLLGEAVSIEFIVDNNHYIYCYEKQS